MSSRKGYIAAIAVFAMFLVAFVPAFAEDSDADVRADNRSSHFDNMNGGSITFDAVNTDNSSVTVNFIVTYQGKEVGSENNVRLPGMSTTAVKISMPEFKTIGNYGLKVTYYSTGGQELGSFNIDVTVEKNVLSNPATYILIIILVIVIVALVYMKVRDSPKKEQNMTFEELEEQRKADMAAKNEKKKKDVAPKTERQRYLESKKKE